MTHDKLSNIRKIRYSKCLCSEICDRKNRFSDQCDYIYRGKKSCSLCQYTGPSYRKLAFHYSDSHNTLQCVYCSAELVTYAKLAVHFGKCQRLRRVLPRCRQVSKYQSILNIIFKKY